MQPGYLVLRALKLSLAGGVTRAIATLLLPVIMDLGMVLSQKLDKYLKVQAQNLWVSKPGSIISNATPALYQHSALSDPLQDLNPGPVEGDPL